jgi:hypothetical protein
MDNTPVPALASIAVSESSSPLAKVLDLVDETGKTFTVTIGPEGLAEVLQELLGVAGHWSEFRPEVARGISGPMNSLAASDIQFGQGRDLTEGAVMLHLGPVQMIFLLPAQTLVQRVNELVKRVKPVPIGPAGTVQ